MSFISAASGGMADYQAQLAQSLFNRIDTGGTGSITKSELEGAVSAAGGTTASADALYADLDPNGTGSVGESQFASTVQSLLDPQMGASLISAQESAQTSGPSGGFLQQLFSQLDSAGNGALTQAELEKAVTGSGGTKASADALWAQLDPSGASSINEQQFAANFPKPGSDTTSTDDSTSSQDAVASLLQSMAPPPPQNGDGNGAIAAAGATSSDGTSALSALQNLIASDASSTSQVATGSSAQDALLALLGQAGNSASGIGLASGYVNDAMLSQWLQPQSITSVLA